MSQVWLYSMVSVVAVSLISLVGVLTLAINKDNLNRWLLYLVSFSAGALLGDVFLHIFPEMAGRGDYTTQGFYLLSGILFFFVLERYVAWHRSHSDHQEEIHSMVYITTVGDTLHNFIDGLIIAASYFISVPVGVATTLAVVFHEIPQEIGNFAILVHGGWKVKKALVYNFLSALAAVAGALVVLIFMRRVQSVPLWLIALAASSFIYISMADLIPEIHKETRKANSAFQLIWFFLGIAAMAAMLLLE